MVVGIFDLLNLLGNMLYAGYYNNVADTHQDKVAYDLRTKEAIKFSYLLAAISLVSFIYVCYILWILKQNRKMSSPPEKIQIVSALSHYIRKTTLFYLVTGLSYLVLVLVEDDQIDSNMIANIFGAGFIQIGVTYYWFKTYEVGCAEFKEVEVRVMDKKTGVYRTETMKSNVKENTDLNIYR